MSKSTKGVFLFSPLTSFSKEGLNLPQKHRSDMNDLNWGLQPLNIQDDQNIRSTTKHFPRIAPLCVPRAESHCGTKQVIKYSNPINMKKNIARKLFFIGCIQGLLGLQQAYAATYYVSPTGADSNNGTALSTPVKTIKKALSTAQSSGDIVYVMTGTYVEAVSIGQSGITLSAYPNNKPVIDGGNTLPSGDWGSLISVNGNYNKISGFEVKNSNINGAHAGGFGLQVGGHHNTISKMNIHHSWEQGGIVQGDYNVVEDSSIWQSARKNSANPGSGGWGTGLSAARNKSASALKPGITSYAIFRRNTVFNNWGEGLSCFETDHCTLEDNIVYDNWTQNLYLSDTSNSLVQRNMVYVSSQPAIPSRNNSHTGITLADEVASMPRSANNTIINNFIYNADFSAFSWTQVANSRLNNVLIAHNTIVDGGLLTGSGGNTNSQIRNNIILGKNSSVPSNSGITFSDNNWSMTPSAAAAATNIVGDPQIERTGTTAPGALTSAYFKILGSSPVINAATSLNSVTIDFFNGSRGTAPDIGGHEFGASTTTTPATTTTAPAPAPAPATTATVNISSTYVGNVKARTATINWSTNIPSTAVISYTTQKAAADANSFYYNVTVSDLATSHSVLLSNLYNNTTYYYKITAKNGSATAVSATSTFKTLQW